MSSGRTIYPPLRAFDYHRRAAAVDAANAEVLALHRRERALGFKGRPGQTPSAEFYEAQARLQIAVAAAYPPGFWDDIERLRNRDGAGIETAIEFLEADPWFLRSGYTKAEIIVLIDRVSLTQSQIARLQLVVLAVVEYRDRREFRHYCRLARKVYSPSLRTGLVSLLASPDRAVRRRAQWVLNAVSMPEVIGAPEIH